jgi:hypothetical protein
MVLDILVIPTYNTLTLGVADASTYDTDPPVVSSPTIEITVPNFGVVSLPFVPNDFNIFNSTSLGLSAVGEPLIPLPDGIYYLKYTVAPALTYNVEKNIMKLDMMECDLAIKTQSKVTLTSISFMISGSIAAANNCAVDTANKLYIQANNMLNNFIRSNCGCSGNNYIVNFY